MKPFDLQEYIKNPNQILVLEHYKDPIKYWRIKSATVVMDKKLAVSIPETGYCTDEIEVADGDVIRDKDHNLVGYIRVAEPGDMLPIYFMLEANKEHLHRKIENLFEAYTNKHNDKPLFVSCCIRFLDNSILGDVTIKLSTELDNKDDLVFYYCNSLTDLKSLCEFGVGDFILTDVYEFSNEI